MYGQLKEPLGKPPATGSPKLLKGLLSHAHSPSSRHEADFRRTSAPVNLSSTPGAAEVNNNNAFKGPGPIVAQHPMPASPRNKDRTAAKTQHKVNLNEYVCRLLINLRIDNK